MWEPIIVMAASCFDGGGQYADIFRTVMAFRDMSGGLRGSQSGIGARVRTFFVNGTMWVGGMAYKRRERHLHETRDGLCEPQAHAAKNPYSANTHARHMLHLNCDAH